MDKCPFGVHQVKFVVQTGPGLGDSGGVGEHADGPLQFGQVAAGHHGGRLIVDAHFEAYLREMDRNFIGERRQLRGTRINRARAETREICSNLDCVIFMDFDFLKYF